MEEQAVTLDRPGGRIACRFHARDLHPVTESRLYQLIRQPGPVADRIFEISFTDPGVQACEFTFG